MKSTDSHSRRRHSAVNSHFRLSIALKELYSIPVTAPVSAHYSGQQSGGDAALRQPSSPLPPRPASPAGTPDAAVGRSSQSLASLRLSGPPTATGPAQLETLPPFRHGPVVSSVLTPPVPAASGRGESRAEALAWLALEAEARLRHASSSEVSPARAVAGIRTSAGPPTAWAAAASGEVALRLAENPPRGSQGRAAGKDDAAAGGLCTQAPGESEAGERRGRRRVQRAAGRRSQRVHTPPSASGVVRRQQLHPPEAEASQGRWSDATPEGEGLESRLRDDCSSDKETEARARVPVGLVDEAPGKR